MDESTKGDRLRKVRGFVDKVVNKWPELYEPGSELALDEAIIAFKGRVLFKVYQPDKPHKWGIKVFVLADAATGYAYRYSIYAGKENPATKNLPL